MDEITEKKFLESADKLEKARKVQEKMFQTIFDDFDTNPDYILTDLIGKILYVPYQIIEDRLEQVDSDEHKYAYARLLRGYEGLSPRVVRVFEELAVTDNENLVLSVLSYLIKINSNVAINEIKKRLNKCDFSDNSDQNVKCVETVLSLASQVNLSLPQHLIEQINTDIHINIKLALKYFGIDCREL